METSRLVCRALATVNVERAPRMPRRPTVLLLSNSRAVCVDKLLRPVGRPFGILCRPTPEMLLPTASAQLFLGHINESTGQWEICDCADRTAREERAREEAEEE